VKGTRTVAYQNKRQMKMEKSPHHLPAVVHVGNSGHVGWK